MTPPVLVADRTGPDGLAMTTPLRPGRYLRRVWAGLGLVAGIAAALLSVAAHRVPYFASDLTITRAIQAMDAPVLGLPMRVLNALGFPPLVDVVYGAIIATLFVAGARWAAMLAGFDALGGAGINFAVKHLVDRPRPTSELVHVEHHIANPSYPAGHVLDFTAFAGFLCCLVVLHMLPGWRRSSLVVLLVGLIALMGVARIDSGEHWPSDVLGGYLLGALWLAVTVLFYDWGRRRFSEVGARAREVAVAGRGLAIAFLLLAPPAVVGSAHAQAAGPDSLAATSEVPWNPPHPMPRRTEWEQVLLLPGRIVSLPLSALGYVTDNLLLRFEQNPRFANVMTSSPNMGKRNVVLKLPNLGDRTGLGGALELRTDVFRGALKSRISAEYTGTLSQYNRTLVTWTGHPAYVQYGYEWRPQDRFYGMGQDASVDSVSDYASQGEFVRGGLTWSAFHDRNPSRPTTTVGVWAGPRSQVTRTGRESGAVPFEERFPALAAATLNQRSENLVYGAGILLDRRSGAPHWSRGARTLLSADRFDVPIRALALHSGMSSGAQFTRFRAEAEGGFSFMRDPRTLRLMVRMSDERVSSNRDRLLVSDLSTLGGSAGLGGYSSGRFHDLDLLLARLSYVFPLQQHLEMDLHSEWGGVYPDLWNDAKLNTLHNSFGFSLRARDDRRPRASAGLDFSPEGMSLRFSLGGVE